MNQHGRTQAWFFFLYIIWTDKSLTHGLQSIWMLFLACIGLVNSGHSHYPSSWFERWKRLHWTDKLQQSHLWCMIRPKRIEPSFYQEVYFNACSPSSSGVLAYYSHYRSWSSRTVIVHRQLAYRNLCHFQSGCHLETFPHNSKH